MKMKTFFAFLALAAGPALAAAQEPIAMWADLAETRAVQDPPPEGGRRRQGGQVTEEWYTPRMRGSLAFYGRASFPSDTDVTIDHRTYADFFDVGLGLSVEGDILSFVTPHCGIGGYLSVGWDRFNGQTVIDINGDSLSPDKMDLTTVIVGGKILERFSPFFTWEGRMGLGVVHYSRVMSTFVIGGVTTPDVEFLRPISRAVFEIGGRVGFGNPHIEADFGFGLRFMGGAARGNGVTNAIDPDLFYTFMIELGLTLRF